MTLLDSFQERAFTFDIQVHLRSNRQHRVMGFSSTAVAAAAAKQVTRLLLLTAIFFVVLSTNNGASGAWLFEVQAGNSSVQLPSDIPAALTNFTNGKGNFSDFLVDLYIGVGHQEYKYNGTTWVNTNVSAVLYNGSFSKVAHHFFIPPPGKDGAVATWASIEESSQVTAAPIVKIPQITAVPLLLLHATFNSGANCSSNDFGVVTHVQRLQTRKGLPPTTAGTTGETFFSKYTAIYAFYRVP